jgi:hypothetical protein
MKRVLNCRWPNRKKVVYVLAKRSHAYQWTSVPNSYNRSKCFSFYQFLYGSDDGYRTAQLSQRKGSGPLTILQDRQTYYIVITDPRYNNREVLATGQPFKMTPPMVALTTESLEGNRRELLTRAVQSSAVLSDYSKFKHIASGTVGEVFSMQRDGQQFVGKLQLLPDVDAFLKELEMQQKFATLGLGLPVTEHQIFNIGHQHVGLLVMPRVQTLDQYLHAKRTPAELDRVVEGLIKLVGNIQHANVTHGDLALFNIFVDDSKLGVLDFDRASADVFAPAVDILRVAVELTESTRSTGGQTINASNSKHLASRGLPTYMQAFGLKGKPAQLDRQWYKAYEAYCKQAKVLCL